MTAANLFRMDDFLLRGSVVIGAPVALVGAGLVTAGLSGELPLSKPLVAALFAFSLAPIVMAIVGYGMRRREKRALALWKIIDREVEISSTDLIEHSDWTPQRLDQAIKDVNNSGHAFIVWDRKTRRVQNGRLRRSTLVVDECTSCSGKMSIEVTIGSLAAVRCPYCHEPIDVARIAEEKARIIDELEADRLEGSIEDPLAGPVTTGEFSIIVFIVLFSVFWPAAVWYCLKHRTYLAGWIQ